MRKTESVYNEQQLGWAAGIIDGEGSICFIKNRPNEHRSPQVSVANTTVEIIHKLHVLFGGRISKKTRYKKKHLQCYDWRLSYTEALWFMKLIHPYLIHPLKKARAKLLSTRFEKAVIRNGRYNSKQLRIRQQLEKDFYSLS